MGKNTNLCALCFSDENKHKLVDLGDEDIVTFKEKFRLIFHLKINTDVSVWKYVCTYCINKIEDFYEFFEKVLKNYNNIAKNLAVVALYDKCDLENTSTNRNDVDSQKPEKSVSDTQEITIIKEEYEETHPVENDLHELNDKNATESQLNEHLNDSVLLKCGKPTTTDIENDLKKENESDDEVKLVDRQSQDAFKIDIPEHLKVRTPKKISDAKIRSFMDLICEICGSGDKFNTFKEMQLHYQIQHDTRGFLRCCGKKIYRKDRVMDHITLHINPDAYKCPECGQRSKSKVLLRIHMKQHLPIEERPFRCDTCDQRFVLKSQLSNHQATHLSAEDKKYVCDECGKAFALKFVLLKHKVTHTPDKPYFCEVCARTFTSKGNLNSHVRTHATEPQPRVQCEECGQWYKNIQTLRSHSHRHRDTRDHVCEICSKKCSSKSSLLQHIRYVHQKISKFECNICQKQFRRRPELTEHLARHTGEILYKCKFCPKTFFSSSNFFAHRKTKHPGEYASLNQQK